MTASAVAAPPRPARPFKGLTPYEEGDSAFFFGRDEEIEVVIANLEARRLTLLYGESGVGKSSLLRAGVMHRLKEQVRRNMDEIGTPELVPVYFAAWRDDPLAALTEEIRRAVATVLGKPLRNAPRRLGAALELWSTQSDADVLVVLDQFEEYLLYHPLESGKGTVGGELPGLVNSAGLRVRFLLAIREDALARLDRFKREIPSLFGTYLRLKHLDRDSADEAIRGPIKEYNRLATTGDQHVDIESDLVEAVLDQVTAGQVVLGQAGQGRGRGDGVAAEEERIETPYLQLVMTRLWNAEMEQGSHLLRLSTLHELGDAQTIVRTHLDEALRSLPDDQQDLVADLFNHLVTPSGTKIAHTPSDLAHFTGHPVDEIEPVLEALSAGQTRILRPVTAAEGSVRYEIFHDVLAAAVLDWRARRILKRQRAAAEEEARAERERLERERAAAEEQARLERRRARTFRAVAGLATLLLVLVGVGAFLFAKWSQHQADRDKSRELAATARDLLDKHLDRALSMALDAYARAHTNEARSALLAATQRAAGLTQVRRAGPGRIWGAALDSSGRYLATAGDGGVHVWDRALGGVTTRLRGTGAVGSVAFAPRGELLAGSTSEGIAVWKTSNFRRPIARVLPRRFGSVFATVAVGAGGQWLAATGNDGFEFWDLRGQRPKHLRLGAAEVNKFAFSPRDPATLAVVAGFESQLALWKLPATLGPRGPRGITAIAFSPDGALLAAADVKQRISLWSVAPWKEIWAEPSTGKGSVIGSLAFSADGRTLASGARDGSVVLWDVSDPRAPERIGVPLAVQADLNTVAWARDVLAVTSDDGEATLWHVNDAFPKQLLTRAPPGSILSPDGRLLASTSSDPSRTTVWNLEGSRPQVVLTRREVAPLAFDAEGAKLLAVGTGRSAKIELWDVRRRQRIHVSAAVPFTKIAALSPNGELATATVLPVEQGGDSADSKVDLWDPEGHRLKSARVKGSLATLALAADGTLAWGDGDGGVAVWRPGEVDAPKPVDAHAGKITKLAFDPKGRVLAVASDDSTISLWDVKTARLRGTLEDHTRSVNALAFSGDGKTLASGATDFTIRLWDVKTLRPLGNALSTRDWVSDLALGPRGLIALTAQGNVLAWDQRFWAIDFDSLRKHLCELLARNDASHTRAGVRPEPKASRPC